MGQFLEPFLDPLKNGSGQFFMISGVPKWVQKGELISVLGFHGAPWAPKSVFGPESCISKPQRGTQGVTIDSKREPKW